MAATACLVMRSLGRSDSRSREHPTFHTAGNQRDTRRNEKKEMAKISGNRAPYRDGTRRDQDWAAQANGCTDEMSGGEKDAENKAKKKADQ